MKRLIAVFIFVAIGSFAFAQNAPADSTNNPNAPEFKFDGAETHDFGEIPQGIPATYSFEFTNVGKEPLVISVVDKSCGCTTPKWTTEPVLPGKKGFVSATYNAAGAGEFMKTVTIHSNAKQKDKVLYIKGKVIAKPVEPTPEPNSTPK